MFWECWKCLWSEDQKFNFRLDAIDERPDHWRHRQVLESPQENDAMLKYWRSVVSDFTLRDLAISLDKLPALSTLANSVRLLWEMNIRVVSGDPVSPLTFDRVTKARI